MRQRVAERQKSRVNHVGYLCEAHEKILLVINILLQDKPDSSIIFCNTSECVSFVRKYLQRCGFIVPASRAKRRVVVASDAAVRDERKRYSCVINFDVPFAVRNYTARLGMLARNADGRCISLLCDYYSDFAPPIIAHYRLQCGWPAVDLSGYHLPERPVVRDWLELASGKERERGKELATPAKGKERERDKERGSGKERERDRELAERTHGGRPDDQRERHRQPRSKRSRPRRDAGQRSQATVSYASHKADQIVAAKSQRKSIWERILAFLTR